MMRCRRARGAPRPPNTRHIQRIAIRAPIAELRITPGRRQAGDVELLPNRHRYAEQRPLFAAGERRVGFGGGGPRALEITNDNSVDLRIERFDTSDGEVA